MLKLALISVALYLLALATPAMGQLGEATEFEVPVKAVHPVPGHRVVECDAEVLGFSSADAVALPPLPEWLSPASGATATERVIDFLFFYTDAFEKDFGRLGESMNEQIRLSVDLLNESMANSGIAATFRIVGIEQLDGMPDSQSRATRMIETEKAAARRRDALGADLVWALVHDPSGTLGVACQPDNFDKSTADLCFTTSLNSCGAGGPGFGCDHVWRTALRHEAGHNLGIAHSPEFGGDPQLSVPARGSDGSRRVFRGSVGYCGGECWGFKNSSEPPYGTVMGGNTLPVFSSSSYDFQGQVVGERGTHEAATALAWTTYLVSHYRPNGPEPPKPPTDCEPTASLIDFPHGYTVSMCFEYEKDGETGQGGRRRLRARIGRVGAPVLL